MKKIVSGMFSSVPDAELLIATAGVIDPAPDNATDNFTANDDDNSLTNSSIVPKATANTVSHQKTITNELDDSLE